LFLPLKGRGFSDKGKSRDKSAGVGKPRLSVGNVFLYKGKREERRGLRNCQNTISFYTKRKELHLDVFTDVSPVDREKRTI
jgi:hypothetical protein